MQSWAWTVIISHWTEALWPLRENKRQKTWRKGIVIFLEHREVLWAEQTWKKWHGMFQWKSFWHLVLLTQIICCHSNSWRLKWPDHNVGQRWRKRSLWLPKDTMARKRRLRVLLAIYHLWRGILKCSLCRGWGLGMSERLAQERRKTEDEAQLWRRCLPSSHACYTTLQLRVFFNSQSMTANEKKKRTVQASRRKISA